MDRISYFDEYLLGNIDDDTLIEYFQKNIDDRVTYTMGAIDCVKFMHDYYDGVEPIYPSEMAVILDKFLESIGVPKELREDITLEDEVDTSCSGCVYEDNDGSTVAISNCVCCSRNVPFAKNDNYKRGVSYEC